MGGDASTRRADKSKDGRIICVRPGFRCIIAEKKAEYFVAPGQGSKQFDKGLTDLTAKLNSLIAEAQTKAPDPKATVGFLSTGRGLAVIWKYMLEPGEVDESELESIDDMTEGEIAALFHLSA